MTYRRLSNRFTYTLIVCWVTVVIGMIVTLIVLLIMLATFDHTPVIYHPPPHTNDARGTNWFPENSAY